MASIMASPAQRRPFAEIGASRLAQLSAKKNTQNAVTESIFASAGKMGMKSSKSAFNFAPPTKRALPSSTVFDDEDFDAENLDPSSVSFKRSKGLDGTPNKKALFTIDVQRAAPTSPSTDRQTPTLFSDLSAHPAPYTAPAGRSPKHKRVGILSRKRTSLSPFKSISPPAFGLGKSSSGGLGFSIDAALSGTLSAQPAKPVVEDVQPKGWFFSIHEDTPEEEAGILMEHSCLTLDISSDDEAGPSHRDKMDRGKENVPPADHEAPQSAVDPTGSSVPLKQRRSVSADSMSEEDRAPLGSLNAEEFYSEGLDATSIEVVAELEDKVEVPPVERQEEVAVKADVNVDLLPGSEEPAPFVIAEDPTSPK